MKPDTYSSPASELIVADVGGTFARLAKAVITPGQAPRLLSHQKYICAQYPDLATILRTFTSTEQVTSGMAVVAIAGLLEGDTLFNANLPWSVSWERTRQASGLASLELINDFEAVAYAIGCLHPDELSPLNGESAHHFQWPALVLGAGTGLGAALRFAEGDRPVLPTEFGHAALAPGNALEMDILARLMQRWSHVDNERALSGTGLMNMYPCLCEIRGVTPHWQTPEQLITAAKTGQDALALETVQVFCAWLGSLTGDMALALGAKSVYLAGGISGHLGEFLHQGTFRERYLNKGVLGQVLQQVPVWRVEHGHLGLLGAAAWYAWQHPAR